METAPEQAAFLKLTMKGSEEELTEIKTMLEEFLAGRDVRVNVFAKNMKKGPKSGKPAPVDGTEATDGAQLPKKRRSQRTKKVRIPQLKQQDGGNGEQRPVFRQKQRKNPQLGEQRPGEQSSGRFRRRKQKFGNQQQPQRQPQSQPPRQQLQQQQPRDSQLTVRRQRKGQKGKGKGFRQSQSQQAPQAQSWGPPPVSGSEKRAKGNGNPRNTHFQLKAGSRVTKPQQGSVAKPFSKKFKTFRSRGGKGGKPTPAF